jgi:nucleoid-associated protein YgaU
MALAKLEITPLDRHGLRVFRKKLKVLFNPETYAIAKTVSWSSKSPGQNDAGADDASTNRRFNAPMLQFEGGASRTMNLELFYDVTEPVQGKLVDDVRKLTNKLVALTRIDRLLGYPPLVRLNWGKPPGRSDFPFTGVITSLNQTFTLFSNNGKPLRADVSMSLTEFIDAELDLRFTDPELTTRRIQRGDTLSNIAADVYRDPAQWRVIAEANQIDDPRQLNIGRLLSIPDLK